ncbi:DNAJ protein JJJ1 [Hirschfeldia incana]|nr:DNAJ protein JJJ1 [Hirschfeldia incana]
MASSSSRTEKRCLYEILNVTKESTPEEIRSSYRRLALQRHPDKLLKAGGISEADATAQFQELVHAYEVLSDPKERAWYDSHRSQILFADQTSSKSGGGGAVPDLFSFFSTSVYSGYSDAGKGFYKVYYDVFNSVYLNEIKFARTLGLSIDSVREAPVMGNVESPYSQVTAFYSYWLGFSTVMDFCWVDEYDVMAGGNRRMRRKMEEENKKVRKKAKREYNEMVRGLAAFVKKRDKRVVDMLVRKSAEMELKKAEERERKRKIEKERLERALNYEEPDWAKGEEDEEEEEVEEVGGGGEKKSEQLYCIVCGKKFKSEKQWKNHEQSKKHKEKVVELRKTFSDVEEEEEEEEIPETVEELEGLNVEEEDVEEADETDDEYFMAEEDVKGSSESEDGDVDDDELILLKNMVEKNKRKNFVSREEEDEVQVEIESDSEFDNQKGTTGGNRKDKKERNERNAGKDTTEVEIPGDDGNNSDENVKATGSAVEESQKEEADPMEYDNRKSTGRRRRSKKGKDKSSEADDTTQKATEETRSETFENQSEYIEHKKAPRSKKSTRGMKSKGTSKKASNNECDRCGEEFDSRTKLFKHIADTGHATVKSR